MNPFQNFGESDDEFTPRPAAEERAGDVVEQWDAQSQAAPYEQRQALYGEAVFFVDLTGTGGGGGGGLPAEPGKTGPAGEKPPGVRPDWTGFGGAAGAGLGGVGVGPFAAPHLSAGEMSIRPPGTEPVTVRGGGVSSLRTTADSLVDLTGTGVYQELEDQLGSPLFGQYTPEEVEALEDAGFKRLPPIPGTEGHGWGKRFTAGESIPPPPIPLPVPGIVEATPDTKEERIQFAIDRLEDRVEVKARNHTAFARLHGTLWFTRLGERLPDGSTRAGASPFLWPPKSVSWSPPAPSSEAFYGGPGMAKGVADPTTFKVVFSEDQYTSLATMETKQDYQEKVSEMFKNVEAVNAKLEAAKKQLADHRKDKAGKSK